LLRIVHPKFSSLAPAVGIVGLVLASIAGCGGGGGSSASPAPSPSAPTPTPAPSPSTSTPTTGARLNESGCALQYTLTGATALTGTDPLLSQQWHLQNTGATGGLAGEDIRARLAWTLTKGAGVRVGVVDDAVEIVHDDLAPNVVAGASHNYRPSGLWSTYPLPCSSADEHGTAVAGLVAAREGNGIGGAGVAPLAALAAYNPLATNFDTDIADALQRDAAVTGVYNNSWGSADDGRLHASEATFKTAIATGIAQGRGGKGAIYTFPAGNGGCYYGDLDTSDNCVLRPAAGGTFTGYIDNANFDGYVNGLGVIPVCAVTDQGKKAWYSEPGANVLVCGTSSNRSGNVTTTKIGNAYQGTFSGTSATTPMVAGVAALMLAVRPELTWRDVRLILAETARRNDATDAGWTTNFGYHFNHKYGFGVADAQAAVNRAATWPTVGGSATLLSCGPYSKSPSKALPDGDINGTGIVTPVTDTVTVDASGCAIRAIEFVEVSFGATHTYSGDLRLRLTSPNGLVSELANARVCFQLDASGLPVRDASGREVQIDCGAYDPASPWSFGSVRHLGESSAGNWTLEVTDMQKADTGTWVNWTLRFWGR
jgi:subtilisin-like proprotein convertase family protein